MAACRQRSCWSHLPIDLLSCIAQHLDSRLHFLRFRAVCSSWRASVPLPPKSPSLPKQLHFRGNYPTRRRIPSFLISRMNVYRILRPGFEAVSDQQFWFIKVEETKHPDKFNVLSPFSRHPIKNLPPSFPKELNLLSFCVEETVSDFSIRQRREDPDINVDDHNPLIRRIKLASDFVSSNSAVAISRGNFCRVTRDGNGNQWYKFDSDIKFRDITNFDRKFFTVNLYGSISERDENTFSLEEIRSPLDQTPSECERYFVESRGHLYLVVRDFSICGDEVYYYRKIDGFVKETGDDPVPMKFRVYKRIPCSGDQQNKYDWVEVTDLGDQVFFVSSDCSFSFSTQDSKGCHGNCIIYVDEITDVEHLENKERHEEDDDNNELWHLKNGKVGLFNLADQSSGSLALFPEYLAMFWPPPTWLMGDQASSSS
ncbi:hypothetical protein V6N13_117883 [Hibiscus sabdariffa]|uniref:F-box domain-containing protein n=1 Tax=Hibiscus sabdariffa TaxID=183260 RepID=A0ABR2Q9H5_9ROSI